MGCSSGQNEANNQSNTLGPEATASQASNTPTGSPPPTTPAGNTSNPAATPTTPNAAPPAATPTQVTPVTASSSGPQQPVTPVTSPVPTGTTPTPSATTPAATGGAPNASTEPETGGAPVGPSASNTAGAPETPGGAGNVPSTPSGGTSASAVCAPGATYGDPLAGMGQVAEIGPPTMGDVTYFAFIEGPIWVGKLDTLFFSDNASSPQERIFKLVPPATTPEVAMESSGSNGLSIDGDDNLVVADQRNHRIVRVDPTTGTMIDVIVPAGSFKPNDVIMSSDGSVYFTDPDSEGRGFYHYSTSGELTGPLLADGMGGPNGILLSLDEKTLFVGDVQMRTITAFDLGADGSVDLESAKLFATSTGNTLDGLAMDCAGNIYGSTATGVEVFDKDGNPLGTVPTGESSNATFGGTDRKTLYVTSRAILKAVTLGVPGLPD